jgi:hypothetical protein
MGETADNRPTYAMRIKMTGERTIAGALTGRVVVQYNMHRGNNNDDQKGGYDDAIMMTIAKPSREGFNALSTHDVTPLVVATTTEMTHATMFQSFSGTYEEPVTVFSFLSPNHNGGGGVNSKVMNLELKSDSFAMGGTYTLSGPADSQKYSKYLGNNPNDQGRNFIDCHIVPNPFVAEDGKAKGLPVVNMCALTGKLTSAGIPSLKPDLYFEVYSTLGPTAIEPDPGTDPDGDGNGGGGGDGSGGDGSGGGTRQIGGCGVAGGGAAGGGFLLAFALLLARRRR